MRRASLPQPLISKLVVKQQSVIVRTLSPLTVLAAGEESDAVAIALAETLHEKLEVALHQG